MTKAKREVDAFKNSSDFYTKLTYVPDFAKHAKENFDEATNDRELGRLAEFEEVLAGPTRARDMIAGVAEAKESNA